MPRKRSSQPAYRFHISGQARVQLGGQDFYLGKYGSDESYARYYALLAEYSANGKQPPGQPEPADVPGEIKLRVRDLTADFRHRELPRFEQNNGHHNRFSKLCDLLDERYGDVPTDQLGPRRLVDLRDQFVLQGCSRTYANNKTRFVVRIFKHGVARELVAPERLMALEAVPPLRKGQGRETVKRGGVSPEIIKATLAELKPTTAAMVRLQRATAMRPSEVFRMTPRMIDRSGDVWMYRPDTHKTEHHGKAKAVPIVGEALEALRPFMFGDADDLCFRTSKGTPWNKDSYRQAVTRAAERAKVEHWTPYQLRHATLQAVRDAQGPEAAQALAGHSRLSTTEIYAKAAEAKAIAAAKAVPKLG